MHGLSTARCLARPTRLVALWLSVLAVSVAARAGDLRDLVEEVLDQQAESVHIAELPIRQALARLGEETGLRFVLDEATVRLMPYGERTRITIDIPDVTLRQGLQRMFDGLGLIMWVDDRGAIRVEAAPVLDRLGRRMKIGEVRLLGKLAAEPWSALDEQSRPLQFRGLAGLDPRKVLAEEIASVRARNALQQLEDATQNLGWFWVPREDSLLIYSRTEDVWRRLERPVALDYRGAPLDDVLIDLGSRIGITVAFEAGVLDRIRAQQRHIELIHNRTTVAQTLERICGSTGTCFEPTDYGVLIAMAETTPAAPRAAAGRVVAILRVPVGDDGTTVDFPFYEDDLPPEFERLLKRKLPEVIEELRRRQEQ